MTYLLALLLCAAVLWLLIEPHLHAVSEQPVQELHSNLIERKERLVQILKDLELDHSTAKLASEEYQRMREPLMYELDSVLKQLERA